MASTTVNSQKHSTTANSQKRSTTDSKKRSTTVNFQQSLLTFNPEKRSRTTIPQQQPTRVNPKKLPLINYVDGDLFSSPSHVSMAHCVSEDLRMGAGIAILFKSKFKRVAELRKQAAKTGQCAILKDNDRFIYYLVTKQKCSGKPTYKTLQSSLETMLRHCVENDVREIAMPRIASGLDGLDWKKVKDIIEYTFAGKEIQITVYMFKKEK